MRKGNVMLFKRLLTLFVFIALPVSLWAQTMHPAVKLLDENGVPVIQSQNPVSTMKTCGACHDTEFIAGHSYHSQVGMNERYKSPVPTGARAWERGHGYYGQWDPLYYNYLPQSDNDQVDFGTADWIMTYGSRHAGGGPAEYSANGNRLDQPGAKLLPVESQWSGSDTWDWQHSGIVEMNCFLCHLPNPDNHARIAALETGQFKWASTATLLSTGLVTAKEQGYAYNHNMISPEGFADTNVLYIHDPGNNNCGQCHGMVGSQDEPPLVLNECSPELWTTLHTGQIFSPERISESGMNIENKENLSRSWDVHAERLVDCVDCHFSLNNPIYYRESDATRPDYLNFDARRLDLDEYLHRPSHQFARGSRANESGQVQANTMRRCESCHNIEKTHNWLPYKQRHMTVMTCESCHIPYMYATAKQSIDWTLPGPDNDPRFECRGIDQGTPGAGNLMRGFEPVLMERMEADNSTRLAPYNLISTWYWVSGKDSTLIPLAKLDAALHANGAYQPSVISALDENGNGVIDEPERVLDTPEKIAAISALLAKKGIDSPTIKAELVPHAIHHDVTHGEWVTRNCESCHSRESKLSQPVTLANVSPPVKPVFMNTGLARPAGVVSLANNNWVYTPAFAGKQVFILGYNKSMLAQITGASIFVLVLLGILVHGSIRFIALAQHKNQPGPYKRVYMYSLYERFWHWMQAIAIIGLIFTGLNIHAPLVFRFMPFHTAVIVHNVLGFLLLINAALAAFYHYSSGKIKNFLPEPKGFFSQAIDQTLYYIKGIFKNEPHPFEKNIDKKLNPLQKITYLVILNILLPVQIITGILIWGAQRWPHISSALGGLGFLVPFHSLMAWMFAAFLILHMYLTTTGYTPTSSVTAMVTGWEKLGSHS